MSPSCIPTSSDGAPVRGRGERASAVATIVSEQRERAGAVGTVVQTTSGAVRGIADGQALVWRGVPYAQPPVGDLRWRAPQDPPPWDGVRDATAHPEVCAQQVYDRYWRPQDAYTGSEDCLYLNVHRPRNGARKLPVYYFIHGGAGNFGGLRDYDPRELAAREQIVVVTVQFRLSVFGFLTHPALRAAGSAADRSGNYALLDLIKGLAWVRDNIAAFGGDPARVVIGGQSNGAGCALDLLCSPLADGMFRGAVLQSVGSPPQDPERVDATVEETIVGLLMRDPALAVGGHPLTPAQAAAHRARMSEAELAAYLRSRTAFQLLQARRDGVSADGTGRMPGHRPVMDGHVLPKATWAELIAAGSWARVPVLLGDNAQEFKAFAPLLGPHLKNAAAQPVPSGRHTWAGLFGIAGGGEPVSLSDVLPTPTDRAFYHSITQLASRSRRLTTDRIARQIKTADPGAPVWQYRFDWKGGGDPALADFEFAFGAAHAMELPFFQGRDADAWGASFTAANRPGRVALQRTMMGRLGAFVRTLDPNRARALRRWPQWSPADDAVRALVFDAGLRRPRLSHGREELTPAGLAGEIAAARAAFPQYVAVFDSLGLVAVGT